MKLRTFSAWLVIALVGIAIVSGPVLAQNQVSQIIEQNQDVLVPVGFTVRMQMKVRDQSHDREISHQVNGVLLDEDRNIIAISATQLDGPTGHMLPIMKQQGRDISTSASEFFVLGPDESEYEATLLARQPEDDLAFIQVTAEDWESEEMASEVQVPESAPEVEVGQEVVLLNQFDQTLNYQPEIFVTRISGQVEDPNPLYSLMDIDGIHMGFLGSPVFNKEGQYLGLALLKPDDLDQMGAGQMQAQNPQVMANLARTFLLTHDQIQTALERVE